jgi:hypothetical protein
MKSVIFTSMMIMLSPTAVEGQGVTGSQFLALSDNSRLSYVVGFMDAKSALLARPGLPEALPFDAALFTCVSAWTYVQTRAIIDRYLEEHPERWQERMSDLSEDALYQACGLQRP